MRIVRNRRTGYTHLAVEDAHASLCGLFSFSPDYEYSVEGNECRCTRCMTVIQLARAAKIPTEDLEASILYTTGTTTNAIRHTHYTYNGARTLCGTNVGPLPKWRADDIERPTCTHCLASPFVPRKYRDPEAVKRMEGRGKYKRS